LYLLLSSPLFRSYRSFIILIPCCRFQLCSLALSIYYVVVSLFTYHRSFNLNAHFCFLIHYLFVLLSVLTLLMLSFILMVPLFIQERLLFVPPPLSILNCCVLCLFRSHRALFLSHFSSSSLCTFAPSHSISYQRKLGSLSIFSRSVRRIMFIPSLRLKCCGVSINS